MLQATNGIRLSLGRASYGLALVLCFVLGAVSVLAAGPEAGDLIDQRQKEAYLVAGWRIVHPEQLDTIRAALDPLAKKAGYIVLGASRPEVLEGRWPYEGILILQRYSSMQALREFWYSPEHLEAKKVREGHIESAFVIAVESIE